MTASQEAPSSSSMQGYIPPSRDSTGFHCPNCGVYAYQWWTGTAFRAGDGSGNIKALKDVNAAFCARCEKFSLWYGNTMVHPIATNAPFPHTDLPDDGKADYEEARSIAERSPRGAAALLRLVIQKLCKELGETGENINADIGNLVAKGLPAGVQKALDIVRVVGNNAVHLGQIDLRDNQTIVGRLFELINMITEKMIAEPAKLHALFEELPEGQKNQIARRDGVKP